MHEEISEDVSSYNRSDPPLLNILVTHHIHRIGPDIEHRIYYVQEWITNENYIIYSCTCPHFHYRLGPYVSCPCFGCKHMKKVYF